MAEVLIADIGATNSRFALVGADGRPARVEKFRGDEVESLEAAIARYIDQVSARPEAGVLAIAGPIEGDEVAMTNRDWRFRFSEVAKKFGWGAIRGINDFEAVAWGLLRLTRDDVRPLGSSLAATSGVRVVFGPGTGLGVAALVPIGSGGHQVVPTEGGHVLFGPASDAEEEMFARLREECGPVSAEKVLSGPGLERLHRALHGSHSMLTSAEVIAGAQGGDQEPRATVETFVRLFGRFAGDLALTFKALGGVYVAGGVARRIDSFLDAPAFRAAFESHPPYAGLLEKIPTRLITFDEPGLLGCAALASELELESRRGADSAKVLPGA